MLVVVVHYILCTNSVRLRLLHVIIIIFVWWFHFHPRRYREKENSATALKFDIFIVPTLVIPNLHSTIIMINTNYIYIIYHYIFIILFNYHRGIVFKTLIHTKTLFPRF